MSSPNHFAEFKADALKQVADRGYRDWYVAERIRVAPLTLYVWARRDPARGG